MATTMLALGRFKFSIDSAAYNALTRDYSFRWQSMPRVGGRNTLQYTGEDTPSIHLAGQIATTFRNVGDQQIQQLVTLARTGEPLLMVTGAGVKLGYWCIRKVHEGNRSFLPGGAPRFQDFSLELAFYGDDLQNP